MPPTLEPILPHIPAFMLVLFRMSGVFIFAPMFSGAAIPARVKVLLALSLSVCIYPLIPPQMPVQLSVWGMAFAVGGEVLIGLVIGYAAMLPLLAMQMAGQLIGQQLGLGLAEVINPDFEDPSQVMGQLLLLIALVVFLLLDGHHAVLAALVHSFEHVPLAGYTPEGRMLSVVVGLLGAMFELAVRVAAPLLCLVFLETVALGFLARTVPQMNILSLGFPVRIVLGLGLMVVAVAAMGHAFADAIREAMRAVGTIFT